MSIYTEWKEQVADWLKSIKPCRKVFQAAILHNETVYTLAKPARHHDIIRYMMEHGETYTSASPQGFIDTDGFFLPRDAAADLAFRAGQIPEPKTFLYSEDLW